MGKNVQVQVAKNLKISPCKKAKTRGEKAKALVCKYEEW